MDTIVFEKTTNTKLDELDFEEEHLKQKLIVANELGIKQLSDELTEKINRVQLKKMGFVPISDVQLLAIKFALLWGFGCRRFVYEHTSGELSFGSKNEIPYVVHFVSLNQYQSGKRPIITLDALNAIKEFKLYMPKATFTVLYVQEYHDPVILASEFGVLYFVAAWGESTLTLKEMGELYDRYLNRSLFSRLFGGKI